MKNQTDDAVIERARGARDAAKAKFEFAKGRLAATKATVLRVDGSIRRSASEEAAARAIEAEALTEFLARRDAELSQAIADLPRRVAERERLTKIERDILGAERKIAEAKSKLEAAEADAAALRSAAADARRSAETVAPATAKAA